MRDNPLKLALDSVKNTHDAVQRAQIYCDYMGKAIACDTLATIRLTLVEFQRTLTEISNDYPELQ